VSSPCFTTYSRKNIFFGYVKANSLQSGSKTELTSLCVFPKVPLSSQRELEQLLAEGELIKHPEYKELDEITKNFNSTHTIHTPERQELRKRLAQEAYGQGAEKKERHIHMLIGNMASGKSVLIESIKAHEGALLVDPDLISAKLPEYHFNQDISMAVHSSQKALAINNLAEETWQITKQVLKTGVEHGDNMVIPYIGSNVNDEVNLAQYFKSHGYKMYYHYVDVPVAECMTRAITRFHSDGRFTNLSKMAANGNRPWQAFQTLRIYGIESGLIDGAMRWDNNGAKGSSPKLMEVSGLRPLNASTPSKALDLFC
jgi:predicted kinase